MPSCTAFAFNFTKSISEILIDMVLFFADVAFAILEYWAMVFVLYRVETNPPFSADFKIVFSSFASLVPVFIFIIIILNTF